FQGQSLDVETGLHYNRFRYYDSDVGMFISRDPIGLMGGNNVFQYAPNPIGWIDPFGLAKTTNLSALDKMSIEASQVLPERTRSAV
ncbi:RHS repeat-associated core domain-containing protein, partial [Lactobacillus paracasei]|uniref:RHS repeat-associated core domain-containing protein n=1 Tax=Lacticaseibacillus paracasei TaxID=1597 RepID=UPI0013A68E2F